MKNRQQIEFTAIYAKDIGVTIKGYKTIHGMVFSKGICPVGDGTETYKYQKNWALYDINSGSFICDGRTGLLYLNNPEATPAQILAAFRKLRLLPKLENFRLNLPACTESENHVLGKLPPLKSAKPKTENMPNNGYTGLKTLINEVNTAILTAPEKMDTYEFTVDNECFFCPKTKFDLLELAGRIEKKATKLRHQFEYGSYSKKYSEAASQLRNYCENFPDDGARGFITFKLARGTYKINNTKPALQRFIKSLMKNKTAFSDKNLNYIPPEYKKPVLATPKPTPPIQIEPATIEPTPPIQIATLNEFDFIVTKFGANQAYSEALANRVPFSGIRSRFQYPFIQTESEQPIHFEPVATEPTPPIQIEPATIEPTPPIQSETEIDTYIMAKIAELKTKASKCRLHDRPTWANKIDAVITQLQASLQPKPPTKTPANTCRRKARARIPLEKYICTTKIGFGHKMDATMPATKNNAKNLVDYSP